MEFSFRTITCQKMEPFSALAIKDQNDAFSAHRTSRILDFEVERRKL